MRINGPLRRAHRWILSLLDELAAALGEESAISRLVTIHNTPVSLVVTVDTDPLAPHLSYRVSWHWRSADQVVRGSGGFNGLETFDEVRSVCEAAYECFYRGWKAQDWRQHMKKRLELVRAAETRPGASRGFQPSLDV